MAYVYVLDGSSTAGKAAPADILTLVPGTGNIVKVIGIQFGSQGANALGPVNFAFGSYTSDVVSSATLTPHPLDQLVARTATLTAKGTVTSNSVGTFTMLDQWAAQQVSHIGPIWFPEGKEIVLPTGSGIWGIRKTVGADAFVWSLSLYVQEG